MRRAFAVAVAVFAALAVVQAASARLTILAASSLTDVFPHVDEHQRYWFGGSDTLAFQIQQGAPADVFAAASEKQPEQLFAAGLVYRPVVFATNRLVVVVPRANPARIADVFDLRRSGVKLVVADPGVPVGAYTVSAFHALGLDDALANVVSREPDVRGVLSKVALGEADAGVVYATDARVGGAKVRTFPIPAQAQPPIRYEVAVVRGTHQLRGARAFVQRLVSKRGRALLRAAGFGVP